MSRCCFLNLRACSAGKLPQQLSREHPTAAELDPFVHQRNQQVFTLLADDCQILQIDNEFTVHQVLPGLFARASEFRCPGRDELAF